MDVLLAAEVDSDEVVRNFNPAHPDGNYTLNMTVPAQRTIAALLCNLDLDHQEDMIRSIKMDGKVLEGNVKKLGWPAKYACSALHHRHFWPNHCVVQSMSSTVCLTGRHTLTYCSGQQLLRIASNVAHIPEALWPSVYVKNHCLCCTGCRWWEC